MEDSLDEITEFFSCNLALAPDPDTAGMSDDLADHVLGLAGRGVRVLLPLPTDRPLGDVVRPHVGSHAGRGLAETERRREMSSRGRLGEGELTLGPVHTRDLRFGSRGTAATSRGRNAARTKICSPTDSFRLPRVSANITR